MDENPYKAPQESTERSGFASGRMQPSSLFNADEQYLINYIQSQSASRWNPFMLGYLLPAIVLCLFGAYNSNFALIVCAFVMMCGFRLYEEHHQRKWAAILKSIVEKYEAALRDR